MSPLQWLGNTSSILDISTWNRIYSWWSGCIIVGILWGVTNPFLKSASEQTLSTVVSSPPNKLFGICLPRIFFSITKFIVLPILPYLRNPKVSIIPSQIRHVLLIFDAFILSSSFPSPSTNSDLFCIFLYLHKQVIDCLDPRKLAS